MKAHFLQQQVTAYIVDVFFFANGALICSIVGAVLLPRGFESPEMPLTGRRMGVRAHDLHALVAFRSPSLENT